MSKLAAIILVASLCSVNSFVRPGDDKNGDDKKKFIEDKQDLCEGNNCEDYNNDYYNNETYFYEPCDYADDIDCVRKFFGDFSDCAIQHKEDNRPVYRKKHVNYLPNINTTLITTKDRITNLDGNITNFYVNKKTQNLVMAVEFKNITIQSKKLFLVVQRVGKEPAVAADYANGTHSFIGTAVIPIHDGKIYMEKSRVYSYVTDGFPDFYFGPKITNSTEPEIQAALVALYANVPTAVQEYFLTEGPGFFLAYFQKYICDFGISLSSE